ncbi:MAG TPA: TetR/AcrR family transcriptional regulator [Syntrophales bacterium]|nr:TetR/AcrR family transcriptional regulator [Syntrophales bacterium]
MLKKTTFNDLRVREREMRKNLIIDAAQQVFAVRTYDKVSMKEIAKEAGISVASIYTYFDNQEALFVEAFFRDTKTLVATLKKEITKNQKIRLQKVINTFIDYFANHDAYCRMMANFMLNGRIGPESLDRLNSVIREILDSFDIIFKKLGYQNNIRLLSHMFFAFLNGLLISFRKYPGRSEKEILVHMKRLGKIFADNCQADVEPAQPARKNRVVLL